MSFLLGLGSLAGQLPQGVAEGQYIAQNRQNSQALGSLGDALSSLYGGGQQTGQQQSQQGGGLPFGLGNLFGNAKQQYDGLAPQTASMVPAQDMPQQPQRQYQGQTNTGAPQAQQYQPQQNPIQALVQQLQQGQGQGQAQQPPEMQGAASIPTSAIPQAANPRVAQAGVAPPGPPQQQAPPPQAQQQQQPQPRPQPQQAGPQGMNQLGNGYMSLKDLVGAIKRAQPNVNGQQMARAVLAGLPILHQEGLEQYQSLRGLIQQQEFGFRMGQQRDEFNTRMGMSAASSAARESHWQRQETLARQKDQFNLERNRLHDEYRAKVTAITTDVGSELPEKQKAIQEATDEYDKKLKDLTDREAAAQRDSQSGDSGGGEGDTPGIIYDQSGKGFKYKGSGDTSDIKNYEPI